MFQFSSWQLLFNGNCFQTIIESYCASNYLSTYIYFYGIGSKLSVVKNYQSVDDHQSVVIMFFQNMADKISSCGNQHSI